MTVPTTTAAPAPLSQVSETLHALIGGAEAIAARIPGFIEDLPHEVAPALAALSRIAELVSIVAEAIPGAQAVAAGAATASTVAATTATAVGTLGTDHPVPQPVPVAS